MLKYSKEFKLKVVNYYLNNHYGWEYVAKQFNIPVWTTVRKWVRKHEKQGPRALYKERRGRKKNMSSKPRKKKLSKEVEEDLIPENQRLKIENEYLKKLNVLVQERIKRENKKK